jgi:hypothetical protein
VQVHAEHQRRLAGEALREQGAQDSRDTSPIPALAMPGLPVTLMKRWPSRAMSTLPFP